MTEFQDGAFQDEGGPQFSQHEDDTAGHTANFQGDEDATEAPGMATFQGDEDGKAPGIAL